MKENRAYNAVSRFLTGYWIYLGLALLLIGALVGYLSGFFFYTGILPCAPPPGLAADGQAIAKAITWNDLNANGKLDSGEPPLPWVTVWMSYPPTITDGAGKGIVGHFKPGCACNCWKGESVSAKVPPGYRATTPISRELTGQERVYSFGFQLEDSAQRPSFPGEPDWFQALTNRGITLTGFHYSASQEQLDISTKEAAGLNSEDLYSDVFSIVSRLSDSRISVQRVSITVVPMGNIATCEMDTVRKWWGKISFEEIIASYCQHSQP